MNLLLKVFCFTVGDASQSLCVVQEDCIDVLTKDGALFTITLPFPVSSLWLMFDRCLFAFQTHFLDLVDQKEPQEKNL